MNSAPYLEIVAKALGDLYDHQPPTFSVLAQWQESNAVRLRVQDAFGGAFSFRFGQDGRVSLSYKEDWELVMTVAPCSTTTPPHP